ncbi:hypothetical protein F9B74_03830 [Pelistega sp. NLN82]|uniref:Uncharacterized protein n=1 Tax=Pelistega ratti TaxID=2652177 RepID=A0A6L9Y6B5_9BURK|nr:hypothetical protein [Pelistega ratti]NEN75457.1 hypothetical protein [Pelistega ratti]
MTDSYGSSFVYIYTNQPPQINIPKYGVFGEDYDTIVIELSCRISELEVYNSSKKISYSPIEIYSNDASGYILKQIWKDGSIRFSIDSKFIFQGITTYFSE